jgi:hypothetical protein
MSNRVRENLTHGSMGEETSASRSRVPDRGPLDFAIASTIHSTSGARIDLGGG